MDWKPDGDSSDIEDRRFDGPSGGGGGPSFGGFGGMHLGIGGTLVIIVLSLLFKTDLGSIFGGGGSAAPTRQVAQERPTADNEQREVQFVTFVFNDVQKTWAQLLPESGKQYRHAKMVLFRDYTESGCGTAESATGPFYCPPDEKVYIDLGFYSELAQKFGAPGEFAQAYVLAHEVGHHVQKLLGIESKMRRLQQANPEQQNPLSVKLELEADCFAGIWAHSTEERKMINDADINAGLKAAASVGDDRLQRMATGHVSPESFTHGSSAQRQEWFRRGLQGGSVAGCDTFGR